MIRATVSLACLLLVVNVAGLNFQYHLPERVGSLQEQCREEGFLGECWALNRVNGHPHCGRTFCAAREISRGGRFKATKLRAHAPDGLGCSTQGNQMCYEGRCVSTDFQRPMQSILSIMPLVIDCYE